MNLIPRPGALLPIAVVLTYLLTLLPLPGACVASDAFFPFADGLLAAVEAGAAVLESGGQDFAPLETPEFTEAS